VCKGWRDPELVAVFINCLISEPKKLALPGDKQQDLGAEIYNEIVSTGSAT